MNLNLPLEADRFDHIYNRGINSENLFKEDRNYEYFLRKYSQYLSPVVDTFAYCLLKNHFHLLIRAKDSETLTKFYADQQRSKKFRLTGFIALILSSVNNSLNFLAVIPKRSINPTTERVR